MTTENERLDVTLNRLCLTRSRSEAKSACEAGAVLVGGRPAKASQPVGTGDLVTLRFTNRLLEVRIVELPGKSVSKRVARDLYEVVREERVLPE
ncbi:MAG: S4 domain-containing protein [Gemmatimonadota bacterium]